MGLQWVGDRFCEVVPVAGRGGPCKSGGSCAGSPGRVVESRWRGML